MQDYDKSKFHIEGTVLVKYTGDEADADIPDGVTKIGYDAFSGSKSLLSVKMPQSVKEIGFSAFKGCAGLNVINLSGVTSISDEAFKWCASDRKSVV